MKKILSKIIEHLKEIDQLTEENNKITLKQHKIYCLKTILSLAKTKKNEQNKSC